MRLPKPTRIYTPPDLFIYGGMFVYAWKRADKWLYVGASGQPISRITKHNVIGSDAPVRESDEFHIWHFPDAVEASAFEAEFISSYRPKFNILAHKSTTAKECREINCRSCHKPFMQKRYWQVYCTNNCKKFRSIKSK